MSDLFFERYLIKKILNATKAKTKLNWSPKYNLQALCTDMVNADLELLKKEQYLKEVGFLIKNEYE